MSEWPVLPERTSTRRTALTYRDLATPPHAPQFVTNCAGGIRRHGRRCQGGGLRGDPRRPLPGTARPFNHCRALGACLTWEPAVRRDSSRARANRRSRRGRRGSGSLILLHELRDQRAGATVPVMVVAAAAASVVRVGGRGAVRGIRDSRGAAGHERLRRLRELDHRADRFLSPRSVHRKKQSWC